MSLTVLIADDEATVREALSRAFRQAGFATILAASGDEAVRLHQVECPDIVLLDLNMPIQNGWQAFEEITRHDPLTPVIIITGRADQAELGRAAGVGALMEKPLDLPLLMEAMRHLTQEPSAVRLSRFVQGDPAPLFFAANEPNSDRSRREVRADSSQALSRVGSRTVGEGDRRGGA